MLDLAVWRNWVDSTDDLATVRVPCGPWLFVAGGATWKATADVALQGIDASWPTISPSLDLAHMSGRLRMRFPVTGFAVKNAP